MGRICALLGRVSSYFLVFVRFPVTRDVPWVNFLLFGTGVGFLFFGLKHAFGQPQQYRGKIAGPILGTLSLLVVGSFCFVIFYQTRQLPASTGAPAGRAEGSRNLCCRIPTISRFRSPAYFPGQ